MRRWSVGLYSIGEVPRLEAHFVERKLVAIFASVAAGHVPALDGGRGRPISPGPEWPRQRGPEWFTGPRKSRPVGLYLTGEVPNLGSSQGRTKALGDLRSGCRRLQPPHGPR